MTLRFGIGDDREPVVFEVPPKLSARRVIRALERLNRFGKDTAFFELTPKERTFAWEIVGALQKAKAAR